jgi:hypothetical protein
MEAVWLSGEEWPLAFLKLHQVSNYPLLKGRGWPCPNFSSDDSTKVARFMLTRAPFQTYTLSRILDTNLEHPIFSFCFG